jgi:hypothetical protein
VLVEAAAAAVVDSRKAADTRRIEALTEVAMKLLPLPVAQTLHCDPRIKRRRRDLDRVA